MLSDPVEDGRRVRAATQLQLRRSHTERRGVTMGVVEPRQDGGPVQVDDLQRREIGDLLVDADDSTVPDADGVGSGSTRIHGVNRPVPEQQVQHRGVLCISGWVSPA